MENKKDISILLTDKRFQKILSDWLKLSEEEKAKVFNDYQITQKDVEVLRQLWLGLDLKKIVQPETEVEDALNETIWKLARKGSIHSTKRPLKKIYERFSRIAAIMLLPILAFTAYLYFQNKTIGIHKYTTQQVTVNAQPGTKTNLTLPDGSQVWLNAGTKISYPNYFAGDERKISLEGEAYFEVVKNKKTPMVIKSGNLNVKVYGTSFNLSAYPTDNYVLATLVEGSIAVSSSKWKFNGQEEFLVEPGQTFTFLKDSKTMSVKEEDTFIYTAWKDGILVFRNNSFAEILNRLSRRYNVDIELIDQTLAEIPIDAKFRDENINEVLQLLSISTPFKYHYAKPHKLANGIFEKSKIYIQRK